MNGLMQQRWSTKEKQGMPSNSIVVRLVIQKPAVSQDVCSAYDVRSIVIGLFFVSSATVV